MPLDWSPLVAFVQAHPSFVLTTHVRPDADGLGSQLALAEALEALGKSVRVVIASKLPSRYQFLDPDRTRVELFTLPGDNFRDTAAVMVLDTGTWNQLGDFGPFLQTLAVPKVVIDHHRTQDDLGATRFVDVSAEATGRLAYEVDYRAQGAGVAADGPSLIHGAGTRHGLVSTPEYDCGNVRVGKRTRATRGRPDAALRAIVRGSPRLAGSN